MPDLTQEGLEARGLRVKALEWDDWGASHRIVIAATSPAGIYRITQRYFPEEMFILENPRGDASSHRTLEAAKAAAQADYEARIRSALDGDALSKLIREAEARGMERAAGILDVRADVALVDMGASAETVDALGAAADAIRAAAAATRKEG